MELLIFFIEINNVQMQRLYFINDTEPKPFYFFNKMQNKWLDYNSTLFIHG